MFGNITMKTRSQHSCWRWSGTTKKELRYGGGYHSI